MVTIESDNDETVFDNNDCNDHQENEIKDTPLMNEFLSGDHLSNPRAVKQKDGNNDSFMFE